MKEESISLTMTELNKLDVIQRSLSGTLTVAAAAELLQRTERHIYRLRNKIRQHGPPGIIHGNRGKTSPRKVPDEVKKQILTLHRTQYHMCNDTHFNEKLEEYHGLDLSREAIRRILRSAGILPKRRRRPPKHRSRRPRKEHAGDMIQFDGSHHDWLSGRGPKLCLLVAVDDATNYIWARFELAETTQGYFRLLKDIIDDKGLFTAAYTDKHSIFRIEKGRPPTIEEQLQGRWPETQLQRALRELGISLIYANSPQAKGRVERSHQFFQDRLLAELQMDQTETLSQANAILKKLLAYHRRHLSLNAPSAFRIIPDNLNPDSFLCLKEIRTVAKDNTFSFKNRLFQLPATENRISWAKAKIELHILTNGLIRAVYHNHIIKTFKPSEGQKTISTMRKDKAPSVPAYSSSLATQHILSTSP